MPLDPTDDTPLLGSAPALADADWQNLLERAAEAATGAADHLIRSDDPFLDDDPAFAGTDDSSSADDAAASDSGMATDASADADADATDGTDDDIDPPGDTPPHDGYGERYDGIEEIHDSPDAIDLDY